MMENSLLVCLERSADSYPDKTAYADQSDAYTFSQMRGAAHRIGTALAEALQAERAPVAVYMEKSVHCVAAYFGVLASGNFYCPVDGEMPLERIRLIMQALRPRAVITTPSLLENARSFAENVFLFSELDSAEADEECIRQIRQRVTENDPAYVLFTSGSTGVPKGVLLPHRVLLRYFSWLETQFDLGPDDVFGNQAPLYFDISTHDIYGAAWFGARMEIIPPHLFGFPVKLIEYLNERHVTTFLWVPSAMSIVAKLKTFRAVKPLYLRHIMFAGEVLPRKQLDYWTQELPEAVYANLYGPTETFVCTGYLRRGDEPEGEPLPIGKAVTNSEALILSEGGEAVRPGEVGELCLRGSCLALGYYGDQQRTAESFVQNPLQSDYPDRIYRTGDLVRLDGDGNLIYVSRRDFQIKRMGYRIELGEIETAGNAIPGVEECACVYRAKRERIVLCYEGAKMDGSELLRQLEARLPRYMLPDQVKWFAALPRNANGKIDRKELNQ